MKITKTTTSTRETSASIDLFDGLDLPKKVKDQVREEVGVYLVEQTLMQVSEGQSPVRGETIPTLKKGPYRDKKQEELGTTRADLQFSGETLDSVKFEATPEGIKIGSFGDRAVVMDGHANLSGKSDLPRRRIIPGVGQEYKAEIKNEVKRIVADALAENTKIRASELNDITTQKELLKFLESKYGPMSKNEASLLVYRNAELLRLIKNAGLLNLVP